MSATSDAFFTLMSEMGSDVTFHREEGGALCPCLSPEGFRSPAWHRANPSEPVCNEEGRLAPAVTEFMVKASVQPVRSSQRRVGERALELFGEVEQDDHIGIFPVTWSDKIIDFLGWSDSGADFIVYNGRRFFAVAWDKLPDVDGDPDHHWEVGLRLITTERVTIPPLDTVLFPDLTMFPELTLLPQG